MAELIGHTDGLGARVRQTLASFGDVLTPRGEIISDTLAQDVMALSMEINREIALFIDRAGRVQSISVGVIDSAGISLISKKRWQGGYAGVRCIHTHPGGAAYFSQADQSALRMGRYDAMVALAASGGELRAAVAMLEPVDHDLAQAKVRVLENLSWADFSALPFQQWLLESEAQLKRGVGAATDHEKERAILVLQPENPEMAEIAEEELRELADTAGLEVVSVISQRQRGKKQHIGSGKIDEIAMLVQNEDADVVVFDQVLTPSANQNLFDRLHTKVIDKTMLILDIFAQRARSREGQLQVELAQLNYRLSRLAGMGNALSRLGGGVGTRGPGETQLETDRRHIRRRIYFIRQELEKVKGSRKLQRASRKSSAGLQVALVGYTNAGKSTLLNALTDDDIYVADQLFATLDPTTRRMPTGGGRDILLSDTVGFIRDLPPQLLDAFKATLEELSDADVLLHVVDISKDGVDERIRVVEDVMSALGLAEKHHVLVCNKIDACEEIPPFSALMHYQEKCYISCVTGEGLAALADLLKKLASASEVTLQLLLPYDARQGQRLAQAHSAGQVVKEDYNEFGAAVTVQLPLSDAKKYFPEFLPDEYKNEMKW